MLGPKLIELFLGYRAKIRDELELNLEGFCRENLGF